MALSSRYNGPADIDSPTGTLLHVYVSQANGDDSNDGDTPEAPLATVQAYIDRFVNPPKRGRIFHLDSGSHAPWKMPVGWGWQEPLIFVGDGAGQPGDSGYTEVRAAEAAQAGTTTEVIVTTGGVTPALRGKTLRELDGSGNPTGTQRLINHVDGNDIYIDREIVGMVAGVQFDIVEPAAVFAWPADHGTAYRGAGAPAGTRTWYGSNSIPHMRTFLGFVNVGHGIDRQNSLSLFVANPVVCFGVEFAAISGVGTPSLKDSVFLAGLDKAVGAQAEPWTDAAPFIAQLGAGFPQTATEIRDHWAGWGVVLEGFMYFSHLYGFAAAAEGDGIFLTGGVSYIQGGGGRLYLRPPQMSVVSTPENASFIAVEGVAPASGMVGVEGASSHLIFTSGSSGRVLIECSDGPALYVLRGGFVYASGGDFTLRSLSTFGVECRSMGKLVVQGGGLLIEGSTPGVNDLTVDGTTGIAFGSLAGGAPQSDGGATVIQREV